jgi:hypothetical protein
MPDWSIKIIPNPSAIAGAPAAFVPDVTGAKPGDPLIAQESDIVTWNNTTDQAHWPWPVNFAVPLDEDPGSLKGTPVVLYMSDRVAGDSSSSPSFVPPLAGTITYCCRLHPEERGTIVVTAIPAPLKVPQA